MFPFSSSEARESETLPENFSPRHFNVKNRIKEIFQSSVTHSQQQQIQFMKNKFQSTHQLTTQRRFIVPFLGIFALTFLLLGQSAFAQTSLNTRVKILDYYGLQGHDSCGRHVYGVKIFQGSSFYYVLIDSDIPCLRNHVNQTVNVRICRHGDQWHRVTFENHVAGIRRIVNLGSDYCVAKNWSPPTNQTDLDKIWSRFLSPFYHND